MKQNKPMSVTEFARLGGKARATKYSREQLSAWGRKGGRPPKTQKTGK